MLRIAGVGGGRLTFLALAHMLNATQLLLVVMGGQRSLHLHTCSMLRIAGVGGGMLTFLALAHMLNATQLLVLVVGC